MSKISTLLVFGAILGFSILPSRAADVSVVVPNANANLAGSAEIGEVLNGYNSDLGQTVQYVIAASDLLPLQNTTLTGLSFRLNNYYAPSLPEIDYSNFTIVLSASPDSPLSTVFADNIQNGTVAYQAPFTFAAGALPTGAPAGSDIPNDFGTFIKFSTPYYYTTGDMLVTLSHSQPSGGETSDYWSVDGNSSATPTLIAHDQAATEASVEWYVTPITEFTTSDSLPDNAPAAIPEPGTYAMIFLGFALLVFWQKSTSFIRTRGTNR